MKTPERALTEWTCDEILFDYMYMGFGSIAHTREQFEAVWGEFRIHPNPEQNIFNGNSVRYRLGDRMLTSEWLRGVLTCIRTYRDVRYGRARSEEIEKDVREFFDLKNLLLCETKQDVINGLMNWRRA